MLTLYRALVLPLLGYCCQLYYPSCQLLSIVVSYNAHKWLAWWGSWRRYRDNLCSELEKFWRIFTGNVFSASNCILSSGGERGVLWYREPSIGSVGAPNCAPMMPRNACPSDSYTSVFPVWWYDERVTGIFLIRKFHLGKFHLENSSYGKKQCSRQFWNAVEREPVKLESSILPRAKRASSETT